MTHQGKIHPIQLYTVDMSDFLQPEEIKNSCRKTMPMGIKNRSYKHLKPSVMLAMLQRSSRQPFV